MRAGQAKSVLPPTPAAAPLATQASPLGIVVGNTALLLVAQGLIKVLAFGFSVFVVRHLGDADFGRYATAIAYVAVFAGLTDLGTSTLSLREMARQPASTAWMVPDIMALRAVLSIVVIGTITVSAWLLGKPPELVLAIAVASTVLLPYAFHGPLQSLLIAQQRLGWVSACNVLHQIVFMAVGGAALLSHRGYVGLLIASLAGVIAMGALAGLITTRVLRQPFVSPQPRRWPSLLRASLPFAVMSVTGDLSRRFDTVFMSFVLTEAAVGWYNVPYNLIFMLLLSAQSFGLSIFPSLVTAYDSGRGAIHDTVRSALYWLLLLALPIATGGTVLADRIILVLYGATFAPAAGVMRVMLWALPSLFLLEILGRTASTLHRERRLAWVGVLNGGVSVALVVLLVPSLGVIGGALAMVIGRLLLVFSSTSVIGRDLLWQGSLRSIVRIVSACAILGIGLSSLAYTGVFADIGDPRGLAMLMGAGALLYAVAAVGVRAVRLADVQALLAGVWQQWPRRGSARCAS